MAEAFIKPENKIAGQEKTFISPSGKYKLVVNCYKTKETIWNYSCGVVIRVNDNGVIAEIPRNYRIFDHSFLTKNGQEWLQAGRTYMSQIFINLETNEIFDNMEQSARSAEYMSGVSFCWSTSMISPNGNTLAVVGCFWGGPYEHKFFDFTNPSIGWPELRSDDLYDYVGNKDAHWNEDGTFTIYESEEFVNNNVILTNIYDCDTAADDNTVIVCIEDQKKIVQRQENKMVTIDVWKSNERKKRDEELELAEQERKKKNQQIVANSEIYQNFKTSFQSCDTTLMWSGINNVQSFIINVSSRTKSCSIKWNVLEGPIYLQFGDSFKEFARELKSVDEILVEINEQLNN